jgi:hypothetical protein
MTWEKLFPQASGLGLSWKVAECAFDRESEVVRWRIEEAEPLWEAERIRLRKTSCGNKKPNKCIRMGRLRHPPTTRANNPRQKPARSIPSTYP